MTSQSPPTCSYRFEIPDPSRPIPAAQRTGSGPSATLTPFEPTPLVSAQVVGRRIDDLMANAGTYGMGGPGFFALKLGEVWLVVALWGAASWMTCQGRLLEDWHHESAGRTAPWFTDDDASLLRAHLTGQTIMSLDLERASMRIEISGGFDLVIAADPATRPVYAGSGEPRAFKPDDDLRRAVFLSPTVELWI